MTTKDYSEQYNAIINALEAKGLKVFGNYLPYLRTARQYFYVDALDQKDWPFGIAENTVYVRFVIDFELGKIKATGGGAIYLTDEDRQKTCLCCGGVRNVLKAAGKAWFTTRPFKSPKDLADKVANYWFGTVLPTLGEYTEGYPYKQLTKNIY